MKLRNKRTGEKAEVEINYNSMLVTHEDGRIAQYYFDSLKDLEEWEDYEEPSKTIWQIKDSGELQDFEEDDFSDGYIESSKSIGNYFSSKEEAEKAVERLRAWKRLKDKGFRFIDHIGRDSGQGMTRYEWDGYVNGEDLDLLFSQEDD